MSASPIAAASASAPATSRIRKFRRSSSSAAEIALGCRFVVTLNRPYRLLREDRQPCSDRSLPAHLVHDVDTVVLPVGARNAKEERDPPPEPEPSLVRDRPGEDELVTSPGEVDPLGLRDAVHVDLE